MLEKLSRQIIWKLKRQHPLSYHHRKNRWEDFCFCNDRYEDESQWEDYLWGEIAGKFEKLKKIVRFQTWLQTRNGEQAFYDFLYEKFAVVIPNRYLDFNVLCQEIEINNDDVYAEVYGLIRRAANDDPFLYNLI